MPAFQAVSGSAQISEPLLAPLTLSRENEWRWKYRVRFLLRLDGMWYAGERPPVGFYGGCEGHSPTAIAARYPAFRALLGGALLPGHIAVRPEVDGAAAGQSATVAAWRSAPMEVLEPAQLLAELGQVSRADRAGLEEFYRALAIRQNDAVGERAFARRYETLLQENRQELRLRLPRLGIARDQFLTLPHLRARYVLPSAGAALCELAVVDDEHVLRRFHWNELFVRYQRTAPGEQLRIAHRSGPQGTIAALFFDRRRPFSTKKPHFHTTDGRVYVMRRDVDDRSEYAAHFEIRKTAQALILDLATYRALFVQYEWNET